jgi:hypothetical protein
LRPINWGTRAPPGATAWTEASLQESRRARLLAFDDAGHGIHVARFELVRLLERFYGLFGPLYRLLAVRLLDLKGFGRRLVVRHGRSLLGNAPRLESSPR